MTNLSVNLKNREYSSSVLLYTNSAGKPKLMRGVFQMPRTYLEWLKGKSKKQEYVMKNSQNGVEVVCTEKFVKHWKNRGFEIVEIRPYVPFDKRLN